MRLLDRSSFAFSSLIITTLISIPRAMAADTTLPALTDTAGANKPASLTSSTAQSTKAAATTTANEQSTKTTSEAAASKLPSLTTSSGLGGLITGLPKLAGDDYPPPSVPPTANAPFMQKSNLPEGTVFICVGAAIAFIALVILAWRGLVAWSLHRSVRKAAIAHSTNYGYSNDKKRRHSHGKPLASPFYTHGPGSTLSLDQLGTSGKPLSSSKPHSAHGSLFFSPTAGAGIHTPSNNRGSGYLPAGYYAAGNSTAGGGDRGSGMQQIGLSNLTPGGTTTTAQPNRYSRARSVGPTPPDSPRLPPSRGNGDLRPSTANLSTTALAGAAASNSSLNLNLNTAPQSRAPSAFLEDLFENGIGSAMDTAGAVVAPPPPQQQQEKVPEEKEKGERRTRRKSKGHTDSSRRKSRSGHGHGHGHHGSGGGGSGHDRRSRGY
ncbi:MAG: hypothetical protein HETSPECPRED_005639 [Heterodermia speciosa]|uniref:Uncharacterized protein n=1 Tax=Heterodermia speciosa TaxID=116794 RepID=A0A8H3FHL3_9LECA|nr:MAG: hypothetical protein HETSPECPRED_005639 [Heterodermia speciosa]